MEQDISVSMQTLTPQEKGAWAGTEMSGAQPLVICRTCNLNPPRLTSRRSQPPLPLCVPLSRFTSRVGGGSAFFVRPHEVLLIMSDWQKTYCRLFNIAGRIVGVWFFLGGLIFIRSEEH